MWLVTAYKSYTSDVFKLLLLPVICNTTVRTVDVTTHVNACTHYECWHLHVHRHSACTRWTKYSGVLHYSDCIRMYTYMQLLLYNVMYMLTKASVRISAHRIFAAPSYRHKDMWDIYAYTSSSCNLMHISEVCWMSTNLCRGGFRCTWMVPCPAQLEETPLVS
jgi:hypothetical protein